MSLVIPCTCSSQPCGWEKTIRNACVFWLLFLTKHLYLIGMWLGEEKRHNSSCYNIVRHVKNLDTRLTFMPVQCTSIIFLFFSFWLGEDQRTTTYKDICFKKMELFSSTFINNSTLNNEHNWQNLCNQWRNQQSCTSDNHNYTKGGWNSNLKFVDVPS